VYVSGVVVLLGAYAYYECDLYKRYEVYGAMLLGVTAVLNKDGFWLDQEGRIHRPMYVITYSYEKNSKAVKNSMASTAELTSIIATKSSDTEVRPNVRCYSIKSSYTV